MHTARIVVRMIDIFIHGQLSIVHCLRGFYVRIMPSMFIFRSLIRGYLVNIITRVDICHPGILSEKNDVLCWYPNRLRNSSQKRHVSLFMRENIETSISN